MTKLLVLYKQDQEEEVSQETHDHYEAHNKGVNVYLQYTHIMKGVALIAVQSGLSKVVLYTLFIRAFIGCHSP